MWRSHNGWLRQQKEGNGGGDEVAIPVRRQHTHDTRKPSKVEQAGRLSKGFEGAAVV